MQDTERSSRPNTDTEDMTLNHALRDALDGTRVTCVNLEKDEDEARLIIHVDAARSDAAGRCLSPELLIEFWPVRQLSIFAESLDPVRSPQPVSKDPACLKPWPFPPQDVRVVLPSELPGGDSGEVTRKHARAGASRFTLGFHFRTHASDEGLWLIVSAENVEALDEEGVVPISRLPEEVARGRQAVLNDFVVVEAPFGSEDWKRLITSL